MPAPRREVLPGMRTDLPEPAEYYRPKRARDLRENAARMERWSRRAVWLGLAALLGPFFLSYYILHHARGITSLGAALLLLLFFGAASAATLLAGAVLWAIDVRRPGPARRLAIPDSSVATATFVTGLALALVGAGFGLWLILIGVGVAALGAGGLVREERARRRALREGEPR